MSENEDFQKKYREKHEKEGAKGLSLLIFGTVGVVLLSLTVLLILFLNIIKDIF